MTSSPTSLWHNPFPSIICSTTNSGSSCYNLSQIVSLISLKPSTNLWGFSSIPSHNSSTSPALIFPGCTLSSGYFFPLLEITSNNSNLLFLLLKIFFPYYDHAAHVHCLPVFAFMLLSQWCFSDYFIWNCIAFSIQDPSINLFFFIYFHVTYDFVIYYTR